MAFMIPNSVKVNPLEQTNGNYRKRQVTKIEYNALFLFQALAFRPQATTSTPMTGGVPNREAVCPQSLSLEARLTQMWG